VTGPSATDPGGMTLDADAIDAFRRASPDGSADFLIGLIDLYLAEAAVQIATIADAAGRRDLGRVKRTAHSLKGSSLVMGAARLAALCGQIEDHVTQSPEAVVTTEVTAALDEELARVRLAFDGERHS